MSEMLSGSMCLTDINEAARSGHSAFSKGKNDKIYFNFIEWINDEPDKFNQDASFQLNSSKEKQGIEPKCYIGHARKVELKKQAVESSDIPSDKDLPF